MVTAPFPTGPSGLVVGLIGKVSDITSGFSLRPVADAGRKAILSGPCGVCRPAPEILGRTDGTHMDRADRNRPATGRAQLGRTA